MREFGILCGLFPKCLPHKDLKNFPAYFSHGRTWPLFSTGVADSLCGGSQGVRMPEVAQVSVRDGYFACFTQEKARVALKQMLAAELK
jgi:hypothetical protein